MDVWTGRAEPDTTLSSDGTGTHDWDGRRDGRIKGWRAGRRNRSQRDSFASPHSHTLITSLGHVILHSCPDDPELPSESACGLRVGGGSLGGVGGGGKG